MQKSINAVVNKQKIFTKSNKVYVYIIFLLSPLLSVFLSVNNYRAPWAKNIIWLFVGFYGYTMVISNEGMDANYYRDSFLLMARADYSASNISMLLFGEDAVYVDWAQPILSFLIASFTSDYKILFLTYGLLFGYFYSRNIWFVIKHFSPYVNLKVVIFIFTFAFLIGFWEINGFRMWTAAHIFFFGAIRYLWFGNKKFLFIAAVSVLFHFSFLLPVLLLLLHLIVKPNLKYLFYSYILTFFIVEIDLGFVNDLLQSVVPEMLIGRVEGYTNVEYAGKINEQMSGNNWYVVYYKLALRWAIAVFISIIYLRLKDYIKTNKNLLSLYSFTILFLAVSNITGLIPSGGRFFIVASLFAFSLIIYFVHHYQNARVFRIPILIARPALLLYCIVVLRVSFETIGVVTALGNPIIAVFTDVDIALIELIK